MENVSSWMKRALFNQGKHRHKKSFLKGIIFFLLIIKNLEKTCACTLGSSPGERVTHLVSTISLGQALRVKPELKAQLPKHRHIISLNPIHLP